MCVKVKDSPKIICVTSLVLIFVVKRRSRTVLSSVLNERALLYMYYGFGRKQQHAMLYALYVKGNDINSSAIH